MAVQLAVHTPAEPAPIDPAPETAAPVLDCSGTMEEQEVAFLKALLWQHIDDHAIPSAAPETPTCLTPDSYCCCRAA